MKFKLVFCQITNKYETISEKIVSLETAVIANVATLFCSSGFILNGNC